MVLLLGVIIVSQLMGDDTTGDQAGPVSQPARPTGPLALVAVDAPDAGTPTCANLANALPGELPSKDSKMTRLALAEPAPQAAAAWAGDRGEPVVLRCGLPKPTELQPTAQLRLISEVNWLPVEGDGATTWYTVDRPVYVAVTIPEDAGTGVIQELSETVAKAVPVP